MELITKSHIDAKHAAGPYFPKAESTDSLFSWTSGSDGYVAINAAMAGIPANTRDGLSHSVYLQYGEYDKEVSAELLAAARAFSSAVFELQQARRVAAEATIEASEKIRYEAPGATWTEACDGSVAECSLDHCVRQANGSVRRTHTF